MLDVHAASLYYEIQGSGPVLLMIPGGPMDADGFQPIADRLASDYTVVTYDCRGNSRSPLHGSPDDLTVEVFADDAANLLSSITDKPAYVLGNSGGATYGLDLVARHPGLVRMLIAHEPPVSELLPDAEKYHAYHEEVREIYLRDGVLAAMQWFMEYAFGPDGASEPSEGASPSAESMARTTDNLTLFASRLAPIIGTYRPDIETLRASPTPIVVGLGAASTPGQLPYQTSRALAARLGVEPTMFPGGHAGFLSEPAAFAARTREVLVGPVG
jgi:pimeloyl-ACP methyl ester carboxylesterase